MVSFALSQSLTLHNSAFVMSRNGLISFAQQRMRVTKTNAQFLRTCCQHFVQPVVSWQNLKLSTHTDIVLNCKVSFELPASLKVIRIVGIVPLWRYSGFCLNTF